MLTWILNEDPTSLFASTPTKDDHRKDKCSQHDGEDLIAFVKKPQKEIKSKIVFITLDSLFRL